MFALLGLATAVADGVSVLNPLTQYSLYDSPALLPPQCQNKSIGEKVDDSCCASSTSHPDSGDYSSYTCSPVEVYGVPSLSVRNYFGCEDGVPTFAEACVPPGLVVQQTYPYPTINQSAYFAQGTSGSCGCGANGFFPSVYRGAGCYYAIPSGDNQFFVKFDGTCPAPPPPPPKLWGLSWRWTDHFFYGFGWKWNPRTWSWGWSFGTDGPGFSWVWDYGRRRLFGA